MKKAIWVGLGTALLLSVVLAQLGQRTGQRTDQRTGQRTLMVDGETRSYVLRKPTTTRGKTPLILVLHGGGGNATNAERMTGMTADALERGWAVAYPNGTGRLQGRLLTWNSGNCCGYAQQQNIDDVKFLSRLIDELVAKENIDPRRVFVTGMSNGGMMSHRLAVEAPDKIAGAAPVAGALNCDMKKGQPVAMIMIHGEADKHVLIQGGETEVGVTKGRVDRSLAEAEAYWIKRNQLRGRTVTSQDGKATIRLTTGRHPVKTVAIADEGHTWPGGRGGTAVADQPSKEIFANRLILDFFEKVSR